MSDTLYEIGREIGDLKAALQALHTRLSLFMNETRAAIKPLAEDLEARQKERQQAETRERGQMRSDLATLRAELKTLRPENLETEAG